MAASSASIPTARDSSPLYATKRTSTPPGKSLLLLGAGGAARGIAFALADARAGSIAIANRSLNRAPNAWPPMSAAHGLPSRRPLLPRACHPSRAYDVVVNCTSIGMHGGGADAALPPTPTARPGTLMVDIVYAPRETPFLRAGRGTRPPHARRPADAHLPGRTRLRTLDRRCRARRCHVRCREQGLAAEREAAAVIVFGSIVTLAIFLFVGWAVSAEMFQHRAWRKPRANPATSTSSRALIEEAFATWRRARPPQRHPGRTSGQASRAPSSSPSPRIRPRSRPPPSPNSAPKAAAASRCRPRSMRPSPSPRSSST